MATYDVNIRSDRVELDLNTTSYNLSLSRVGAQGSAGSDAEDLRLEIHDINMTYQQDELVLENANQGARLYRAIQNVPAAIPLSNTTYWQAVGEDNLAFGDTSTIDLSRAADGTITASVIDGSIGTNQLQDTTVTAATYTNATVTVDTDGRITSASSGVSGGGGHQIPSEHASMTLSVSERAQGSPEVTVTGTLTVDSRYTFVGTGDSGGSGGNESVHVRDGDGNAISVTKSSLTANTFSFTLTATEQQTAQTITAYANITATYSGTAYSAQVSDNIVIYPAWYTEQTTSVPTTLGSATNRGRLNNPETLTFTKSAGNTVYVLLPTVSGRTYVFRSGLVFLSTTARGTIGTTHTVYSLDDFPAASSGSITIEISY